MAAKKKKAVAKPSRTKVIDALFELHEALRKAYWSAVDQSGRDRLTGLADVVFEIHADLSREGLRANTAEFKELTKVVTSANTRLTKLKNEIDDIVNDVKAAVRVGSAIDDAVKLAVRFFV